MSNSIPTTLYHYCTLETFVNIIKTKTLRFADISKSNDNQELKFFFDNYFAYLKHLLDNDSDTMRKQLDKISNVMYQSLDDIRCFCLCLSEERDLLSQWRGYVPNGGISIGFNFNKIKNWIQKISFTYYDNVLLNKVGYYNDYYNDAKLMKKLDSLLKLKGDRHLSKLRVLSVSSKMKGFQEEKEYRLWFDSYILGTKDGNALNIPEYNCIKSELKWAINRWGNPYPYYDIIFPLDMIDEIVIGPKLALSKNELKSLIHTCLNPADGLILADVPIEDTKIKSYK